MKCSICGKELVSGSVFKFKVNEDAAQYMCDLCADRIQNTFGISGNGGMKTTFTFFNAYGGVDSKVGSVCCSCGTSISDINRSGFFGCADCYAEFRDSIRNMLSEYHGGAEHRGKRPADYKGTENAEIERLHMKMKQAIEAKDTQQASYYKQKIEAFRAKR